MWEKGTASRKNSHSAILGLRRKQLHWEEAMQRIKDIASRWNACAKKVPFLLGGRPSLPQGEWLSMERGGQSRVASAP